MESYKPRRVIVHLHAIIDVVFQLEDRELTIEILGYRGTYFVKWFMHVFYPEQQDRVGKDYNILSIVIILNYPLYPFTILYKRDILFCTDMVKGTIQDFFVY